jgi:hypothetical protein
MHDEEWEMVGVPPVLHQRSADFCPSLLPNGTPGGHNESFSALYYKILAAENALCTYKG